MATIVVGVGGGVAAFKAATLIRIFSKLGHTVRVIPTEASREFVGVATWEALSGTSVYSGVFEAGGADHVEIARTADLIVIAPATADLIARMAHGLANDLLTTTLLASRAPVVIAPAMHTAMWEHPATQDNLRLLQDRGVICVAPVVGDLSSGDHGQGRMQEPEQIATHALGVLTDTQTHSDVQRDSVDQHSAAALLAGRRIVITAGGTHEPIDPVRFIGNRSTGHQGVALALSAAEHGGSVDFIAANIDETLLSSLPPTVRVHHVSTASQMHHSVFSLLPQADALIMAAAVADFRPDVAMSEKIKKTDADEAPLISLVRNPDILAEVSASPLRPPALIGFAAETGDLDTVLAYGRQKAARKNADLLVVNRVGNGHGFGAVNNEVHMMSADGQVVAHVRGSKSLVSEEIINELSALLRRKKH